MTARAVKVASLRSLYRGWVMDCKFDFCASYRTHFGPINMDLVVAKMAGSYLRVSYKGTAVLYWADESWILNHA